MWFLMIFLKSRDVKTWRRTSKPSISHRSEILWGTFCNQLEVSATSGSKVRAHYLIFTKVVTLTLPFIRFSKKKLPKILGLEDIICQKIRTIGAAVWSVHRETTDKQTDRQTDERALRECILCKIGLTDWVIYLVDWLWQRWRTQSIGPSDSNEKCAMSRVLFRINIAAIQKIRDLDLIHLTLTYSLDLWPWYLTLRLIYYYLDAFEENITKMFCFDVMWRKNGTSFVSTETNLPIHILSVNVLQPTRSLYDFRFQSYGSKGDFHGFWCVWPWPWHFKVIWFLWIRHLFPCMTGVNFEAISSLIAEIYHIEIWRNSLYFIMGIFVAMATYVTFFGSIQYFVNYIG